MNEREKLNTVELLRMEVQEKTSELKLVATMALFCHDFSESEKLKEDVPKVLKLIREQAKDIQNILDRMDEVMIRH